MPEVKAIIYSRVSTDAQERDGTSLDTQERACLEYAKAAGWRVQESIRDTASGFTLERQGIERVRLLLRGGNADVVLSYAVDRLSRNQNHIGVLFDEVQQAGARMEFATEKFEDTAIGRFILSVRAFVGEVEREKIKERTGRGKAERARSGRIPQAFGKGMFGYTYNRETGHREIEDTQAVIVRDIFKRFAETRSLSAVSKELNAAGVQSFTGGRWYPLTIRRMLTNESFTGRTIYRRTMRVKTRATGQHPRGSKVIVRPEADWISVDGATPQIIDTRLWQRIQAMLSDPERAAMHVDHRHYALRGRLKCGLCGSAMVGQTLTVKKQAYRYYRCRHIYDQNVRHNCIAKYVRGDELEQGVWDQIKHVLSHPEIVLAEVRRQSGTENHEQESKALTAKIEAIRDKEKRLVRLFTLGQIDESAITEEATMLRNQRAALEQSLAVLQAAPRPVWADLDERQLAALCRDIAEWLDEADPAKRERVLEALQVTIHANQECGTITLVLPVVPPEFISQDPSCPCT